MRLDKFLQITGLIKRRVLANEACKRGLVKVNGIPAKPTREIVMGDIVELDLPRRDIAVRILKDVTGHSLPRSRRAEAIEIIRDIAKIVNDDLDFPWNDE
ncbi:MAG: RNA-binding S4 domain-containing protein [Candidatus Riflebacteria bacterium]|nr:RNA-binding S4 domain-containing protein [Candidatus Riflebacteria bacterium]